MVIKKKGKIIMAIVIGLSCFILSMVMFMQFKVVNQTDITSIENMREAELRAELSNWKQQYDEVDKRYQEVTATAQEYQNKEESDNETSQLLQSELSQINMLLGKTDVTGPGIEIVLKETESTDTSINASDLLVIVNSLKQAGAEAISINEERVVSTTEIVNVDTRFIIVNGKRIVAPYEIKAIGDKKYLESAISIKGGYVDEIKAKEITINYTIEDNVVIPKFSGKMSLQNAKVSN